METNESNRSTWRFVDGSLAVTASMAIAVAISYCQSCTGLWGLGFFKGLTEKDDGVIILGTLLLFPSTVALYGVLKMWFAAKEAVEKKAAERGRQQGRQEGHQEGRQEGRQEERERIKQVLVSRGITPPPEIDSPPADGSDTGRPQR